MMREEGEHPAASSPVALTRVPCAGELGRLVAIATAAKNARPPPSPRQDAVGSKHSLLRVWGKTCGGVPRGGCRGADTARRVVVEALGSPGGR